MTRRLYAGHDVRHGQQEYTADVEGIRKAVPSLAVERFAMENSDNSFSRS